MPPGPQLQLGIADVPVGVGPDKLVGTNDLAQPAGPVSPGAGFSGADIVGYDDARVAPPYGVDTVQEAIDAIKAGGGGGETLQQTLALGNFTGGTDLVVTDGDAIVGEAAAGGSGLAGKPLRIDAGAGDGVARHGPIVLRISGGVFGPGTSGSLQVDLGGDPRGFGAIDLQIKRSAKPGFASEVASGDFSFIAGGEGNTASGKFSHAEGRYTKAGDYGHAEGFDTYAGYVAHAEGGSTKASGYYSHSEGQGTTASGYYSHAEGRSTTASGGAAHAEGSGTSATADYSHAEGWKTVSSGDNGAHAEGLNTVASGDSSHAEGWYSTASGNSSSAQGRYPLADRLGELAHASGRPDTGSTNRGQAQGAWFSPNIQTTTAAVTELLLGDGGAGTTDRMILRASTTWTFSALVTARRTTGVGAGDSSGWRAEGVIRRDGAGNTVLVGAAVTLIFQDAGAAAWVVAAVADDVNEALRIDVTGEAADTVLWEAHVWISETGLGT